MLLDDYTKNLEVWEPPAVVVKLLNDINNSKGSWKGNKISFNRSPREIATSIEKLTEGRWKLKDQSREVGQQK